jgi:hypothetical protein
MLVNNPPRLRKFEAKKPEEGLEGMPNNQQRDLDQVLIGKGSH